MSSQETQNNQSAKTSNPISEETMLKISKEITIKFIEMGRVTPSTFSDSFKNIHTTIKSTVNNND